jgi:hypothetical protein
MQTLRGLLLQITGTPDELADLAGLKPIILGTSVLISGACACVAATFLFFKLFGLIGVPIGFLVGAALAVANLHILLTFDSGASRRAKVMQAIPRVLVEILVSLLVAKAAAVASGHLQIAAQLRAERRDALVAELQYNAKISNVDDANRQELAATNAWKAAVARMGAEPDSPDYLKATIDLKSAEASARRSHRKLADFIDEMQHMSPQQREEAQTKATVLRTEVSGFDADVNAASAHVAHTRQMFVERAADDAAHTQSVAEGASATAARAARQREASDAESEKIVPQLYVDNFLADCLALNRLAARDSPDGRALSQFIFGLESLVFSINLLPVILLLISPETITDGLAAQIRETSRAVQHERTVLRGNLDIQRVQAAAAKAEAAIAAERDAVISKLKTELVSEKEVDTFIAKLESALEA